MNMKTRLKTILLLLLAFTIYNCETDDSGNGTSSGGNEEFEFGVTVQRDFVGTVVDESNLAISNATVNIGVKTAQTDANGVFLIEDANVQEQFAYIEVSKSGYLKGMKTVVPTDGANTVAMMLLTETVQTLPASNEILMSNGTKVTFDGNFEDASGNAYSGSVYYSINYIDPSSSSIEKEMPGMLLGETTSGDFEMLETYGMVHVNLTDASGNALQIATGSTAEIRMPVLSTLTNAPTTIPLWSFDEGSGYWVEEGSATLTGSEYVGTVSHFSWWNCDANFPTTTFCLNVEDESGNPLANVQVDLSFGNYPYPRIGISNANGEICGLIPTNETLTLVARDYCGNSIYTDTIGPFSSSTSETIVISSGTVQQTIVTGNFLDCSYNPVTSGYVQLNYGELSSSLYIDNGIFEISTLICSSNTNVTLVGVDYQSAQSTGEIPFILTEPVTDLGSVISCNAIDEYITYQVDNEPIVILINQSGGSNSNTGGFSVLGYPESGEFYFSIDTTALGTYTLADFNADIVITEINLNTATTTTQNFQFTITGYGAIGEYIDVVFSGDYVDSSGVTRSLSGTFHVRRSY